MHKRIIIGLICCISGYCSAATHYVVTNGTPGWTGAADPYTNWATAGTNIIDVVNAAMTNPASRVVWVTNGTYYPTNVINITNALTLQSVNGRSVTILSGQTPTISNRCAVFSAANSVFDGFTVTNFYILGKTGIVSVTAGGVSIINCTFVRNSNAYVSGTSGRGSVYISASGNGSIITNCIFSNNYAYVSGGGVSVPESEATSGIRVEGSYFYGNVCDDPYAGAGGACYIRGNNCIISNCIAINNTHYTSGGGFGLDGSTANKILNCSIISNNVINGRYANGGGGGVELTSGLIKNCSIIGNHSATTGGGVYATSAAIIQNCLIAQNKATGTIGQIGGGVYLTNGSVESCTIVSNYAGVSGGGLYIKDVGSGTNNIIYFNTAPSSANFTNTAGNTGLHYSCVIPAVDGTRNITNDPSLVNLSGNYRLNDNSPCVNAGVNQSWMTNTVDLDGRQRIRYRTVDMGAFEGIYGGTIYGFH